MGIVYMLSWNGLGYIGSTVEKTIGKRMKKHRYEYKKWLNGNGNNCGSFNIINKEGYEVIVIEEVENETVEDCREREQFWFEFYSDFGKLENYTNPCGQDKNKKLKNRSDYRIRHREKINKRQNERYKLNKLSLHNTNGKQD